VRGSTFNLRELNIIVDALVERVRNLERDTEQRLRTLEAFRWKLIGIAFASGGAGVALGKFLGG
jgi:hypothetical protein